MRLTINNDFYKEMQIIYIAHQLNTEFYKIGKSTNFKVKARLQQLNTASPNKIKVIKYYYVDNSKQAEIYLHSKLALKRLNGEWFELSEQDLKNIDSNIFNEITEVNNNFNLSI